ncbi:MAG: TatD family hydrolase [Candidatus Shapirobacteria bacterium]|nr:TatD family hydrolase [Candidatus Shapirobacteria bacterium]
MIFDTHCHLNFEVFNNQEESVISRARKAGINYFLIPGSDLPTSQKALNLAKKNQNVFASAGIHPHHAQDQVDIKKLESLIKMLKVCAVGEIGLDYHQYPKTKHENYQINSQFKEDQKILFIKQIKLAQKYQKSIIFHNREAKEDLLTILKIYWNEGLKNRTVLHCCEPDEELLAFAKKNHIFIGVDGDVTCWNKKARFIKKVPLEMLVLETDSPYLTPEPIKKEKSFPNEPKNLILVARFIANLKNVPLETLVSQTTVNAQKIFNL